MMSLKDDLSRNCGDMKAAFSEENNFSSIQYTCRITVRILLAFAAASVLECRLLLSVWRRTA